MRTHSQFKAYARKLLELSLEAGRPSPERVEAVLTVLRERPTAGLIHILRHYARLVERAQRFSEATVETAGDLQGSTLEALQAELSRRYGRPIATEVRPNPELLAGIRIRIGDDVWDDNVATHLQSLHA